MKKRNLLRCTAFSLLMAGLLLLGGCGETVESDAYESEIVTNSAPAQEAESTASQDPQPSVQSGETVISLAGDRILVDGEGAEAEESSVTITQAGTYRISGSMEDGQILVKAKDADVVLILDSIEIQCSNGAPICITKAASATISPAAGTQNFVADTAEYNLKNGEDEPDGAIYSSADLIFDGEGALTVNGNYSKAVHGKDTVCFRNGTYCFSAVGDAVKGKDAVEISGGSLEIDAGEDGIQSNNDTDENMGNISITGGNISITAGNDGIQAETLLSVSDAALNLTTGEEGLHCEDEIQIESGSLTVISGEDGVQAGNDLIISGGNIDIQSGGGSAEAPEHIEGAGFGGWFSFGSDDASESAKGIKAGKNLTVSGGTLNLDCMDDALHCADTLTVTGNADITVKTGDDALHSDGTLAVESGTIDIAASYEGLEAVFIEISGGEICIVSSDDGLNAAGGDSVDMDFAFMGMMGGEPETPEDAEYYIRITGGTLYVDAGGDGLDSNGALFVEGGNICISGPTSSANGAIDYTTTGQITGGTIVAAGSSGMAQNFDTTSTQVSLLYTLPERAEEESQVRLIDSDGNVLVDEILSKNFNSVVISTPALQVGETYTLCCGDDSAEVTLTDTITTISSYGGMGGSLPDEGRGGSVPGQGMGGMGNNLPDEGGENSIPDQSMGGGGMIP